VNRRRAAAALFGSGVVAGAAATVATGAYLRREYRRPDQAADHSFDALSDLVHRTVPTYDGGELHVMERGQPGGRPLVFVHGVTLAGDIWKYQLRDLADEFRVIALDQRGHGRSTAGRDGYGLDKLGRDLVAVLETLDLRGAILVGHSMGGFAVMQLLTAHPDVVGEHVAGVVLTNTAAEVMASRPAWTLGVARRAIAASTRAPRPQKPNRHMVYLGSRYTFGLDPSPTHVRFIGELGSALPPEIFSPTVLAFLDMDLRESLRDVHVPALVVAGTHDRLTPVRAARDIATNLPGAELVVLEGAGHTIMLERHERLNELIREFAGGLTRYQRAG
jgi:non-heme chloroperoxidase